MTGVGVLTGDSITKQEVGEMKTKGNIQVNSLVTATLLVSGLAFAGQLCSGECDPYSRFYKGDTTQKAWGITKATPSPHHDDDHFAKGDVFVLKEVGGLVLFIPGKSMKARGWDPQAIALKKVGDEDTPILCAEKVSMKHGESGEKKDHVFAIGPANDGSGGIIIRFGDQNAGDNCREFSAHGGVAHGENN